MTFTFSFDQDDKRIVVDVKTPNVLRLKIVDLQPEDSHNYTCRAENKAGQHAWNGTITVHCEYRNNHCPHAQ